MHLSLDEVQSIHLLALKILLGGACSETDGIELDRAIDAFMIENPPQVEEAFQQLRAAKDILNLLPAEDQKNPEVVKALVFLFDGSTEKERTIFFEWINKSSKEQVIENLLFACPILEVSLLSTRLEVLNASALLSNEEKQIVLPWLMNIFLPSTLLIALGKLKSSSSSIHSLIFACQDFFPEVKTGLGRKKIVEAVVKIPQEDLNSVLVLAKAFSKGMEKPDGDKIVDILNAALEVPMLLRGDVRRGISENMPGNGRVESLQRIYQRIRREK